MNPLHHPPRDSVAVQPPTLVVEFDEASGTYKYAFSGAIRVAYVVNALEVIKAELVLDQLRKQSQAHRQPGTKVVLADGSKPAF